MDALLKIRFPLIILEALFSLLFLAGALWSISGLWTCPKGTPDCEGWAILGAYILGPIGIFFGIGSGALAKSNSWASQIALIPAFGWFIYWWLYA